MPSPSYDVILFDLDGTLTDSYPGVTGSVRAAIDGMGLDPPDPATLRAFMGPPLSESFKRVYGHLTQEQVDHCIALYREDFTANGIYNNRVYTGIPHLLRRLRSMDVALIVATSKPTVFARRVLEHFGLLEMFDAVIGVELDEREHDKADIVRAALPARYRRAAMVGDRHYDMRAAKANNIDAIGALYGYGGRAELVGSGADAIAEDVSALGRALCGFDAPAEGLFITLEGLDGSGKTTQMPMLAERLERMGFEVVTTREPGGLPLTERIRDLLKDTANTSMTAEAEAYLFAASRAQHVRELIAPALARGAVVISDRFTDSSVAYQGGGRELGLRRVQRINEMAVGACVPDLTLLFLMDPAASLLRRGSATRLDRLERAGEAFFTRVYDAFVAIGREEPDRVKFIDASQTVEDVTRDALGFAEAAVRAYLGSAPVGAGEGAGADAELSV
ncbi:MAG: dTMP kinase [Oscillospiraceae bacterium]|jgi:phosphoglycolate phosphatase|nr:dTMP kinase [Oscillospiraceae bacterium]